MFGKIFFSILFFIFFKQNGKRIFFWKNIFFNKFFQKNISLHFLPIFEKNEKKNEKKFDVKIFSPFSSIFWKKKMKKKTCWKKYFLFIFFQFLKKTCWKKVFFYDKKCFWNELMFVPTYPKMSKIHKLVSSEMTYVQAQLYIDWPLFIFF